MKKSFKVVHLYPKHMSLYGDRGNVIVLAHLAKELGLEFVLQDCLPGERIRKNPDLILLGGGQDTDQGKIVKDLLSRKGEIKDAILNGSTFLGICGGYQLLGEYYEDATGQVLEGLQILNLCTKKAQTGQKRIIGNLKAHSQLFAHLFGFENHGGRTFLGDGLKPLATVLQGGGNNGQDKSEGVIASFGAGTVIGTYLHGFLPKNVQVAKFLINQACNLNLAINEFDHLEASNRETLAKLPY